MTYDEALQFWLGRINFEVLAAQPGDLNLDRMRTLLDLLGQPQNHFRIIHIAGSKGKGSTSAMLAHTLTRAGYRTGLFTSPHLVRVEERFQVDGETITPQELSTLLTDIRETCRSKAPKLEQSLTFFEICTAIGFLHFARRRVQFAVLEVGLGGRFDSTNVCYPLLAIITSISFDHMQLLGNSLARIAWEKGGIIKKARPTISGVRDPEPRFVIEEICAEKKSPLRQLDRDIRYHYVPGAALAPARVFITTEQRTWPGMELKLAGEHQADNASLVVAGIEELQRQGLHIPDRAVREGLAEVVWHARMEVVSQKPWIVIDCAHNIASVHALVKTLEGSFPLTTTARRFLIFAASRDKELSPMLEILGPHFSAIVLTSFASNARAMDPQALYGLLPESLRAKTTVNPSARGALAQLRTRLGPDDLICVTGSVFLAGELRPQFGP